MATEELMMEAVRILRECEIYFDKDWFKANKALLVFLLLR